jgi:expansin (peptidoglycan-binding protein)
VQGLHAPVQHFGEAGDFGHVATGTPESRSNRAVPPVEINLGHHPAQIAGEFDDLAGLVGDTDQYALDFVDRLKATSD